MRPHMPGSHDSDSDGVCDGPPKTTKPNVFHYIFSSSYSSSCGKPKWNLPHFAQSTSTASPVSNAFTRPPDFLSSLKKQHTKPSPLTSFCQLGITNPKIVPSTLSKLFCSVVIDLKAPLALKDIGVFRPMLKTSSWIFELEVPGVGLRRCVGWKTTTEVCDMHAPRSAAFAVPSLLMV